MPKQSLNGVLQHLRKMVAVQTCQELSDRDLLERFVSARDEAAFTVLIERHGPMVLGVCQRALPNFHDAEDACQATFLVLARKAASVRKKASLSTWLHGVACRAAANLKRDHARRKSRERARTAPAPKDPAAEVTWREMQAILDEELQRLPERYRAPMILCYLECMTREDAARQLGVSLTTLHGRLERARDALRESLTRRGLTLAAAMSSVALGEGLAHAALAPTFVVSSTRAAMLLAAGQSVTDGVVTTPVLALTQEVLKTMFLTKLKLGTAAVLCAGLFVAMIGGSLASLGIAHRPEHRDDALPPGALFRFGTADRKGIRTSSAYSPDGRVAAVGDDRGRLDLWDARTGKALRTLRTEGPAVRKLAFTPHGQALVECRAENIYQFWAMPNGVEGHTLGCDLHSFALAFSPDGRDMLYGGYGFRICNHITGKVRWTKNNIFEAGAFSADGKTLLHVSGHYLNFLDAASGDKQKSVELKTSAGSNECFCSVMTLAPDGRRLALGMQTGEVYFCDPLTGGELKRFHAADRPGPGKDAKDWGYLTIKGVKEGFVTQVAFSPDSKWLGTCGSEGDVHLWEVATCREVLRLKGHKGWVVDLAFGSDGRTLLTSGEDGQAYLWSLRPPSKEPGQRSLEALWAALAAEPAQAYRALWELSEMDRAVAFLRGKVLPAQPDDRLPKWIADLDNDVFATREKAQQALADQGEAALPELRRSLAANPSAEQRRRIEALMKLAETQPVRTEPLSATELREERAILVLEMAGTAEARQTLQALARGAPGALRTTAAQAALKRVGQ